MDTAHFLRDLLIVFAVSGVGVFLFQMFRAPAVVGLLVAGMVVGPHGLGLIQQSEQVEVLAEIGVVVLLFAVGLEFSLPRIVGLGRLMLRVGMPQVLLCTLAGTIFTWRYFGDFRPAIFVGILLAMSSTAVVFKLLTDRGELSSPQGNISAAVLLFQDLMVVICMIVLPLLSATDTAQTSLVKSIGLGTAVVVAMMVAGRYLVPVLLFQVARMQNRELFLIVLVLLCLGSSALTATMGWSLALGAFLAGLALSESEYATQTLAEVLPFRDTLSSLFFVSVGMLLDIRFVLGNLPVVGVTVASVVLLKFFAGAVPALFSGYPVRVAILVGVTLAQVGEFSFILADRGLGLGLLNESQYQTFLAAAVVTVALTPLLIAIGPRLANAVESRKWFDGWSRGPSSIEVGSDKVTAEGHVIVIGYGLNGRNLARVLKVVDIEYVVLEMNPETVRRAKELGEPVYYGDCTRPAVLEHLGIHSARLLVVAISDPVSCRRAVQLARTANPQLHIIVRTRYLAELPELRRLGANNVIPEEFETSVEIFARVLGEYEVPRNLILYLIDRVREEHYQVLRDVKLPAMRMVLPHVSVLEKLDIESCWIREGSKAVNRTVGDMNLRAETGATLVAVRRDSQLHLNPGPDLRFQLNDIAFLIGDPPQVHRALCLLDPLIATFHRPTPKSS